MAKRLFFVSAAILMLVCSSPANAGYVDHSNSCDVATSGDQWILTADGRVFGVGTGTLIQENVPALPLPVSQIVFWEYARWAYFVDTSDNVWLLVGGATWSNLGTPPGCGTVNVEQKSWGNMKQQYREE